MATGPICGDTHRPIPYYKLTDCEDLTAMVAMPCVQVGFGRRAADKWKPTTYSPFLGTDSALFN